MRSTSIHSTPEVLAQPSCRSARLYLPLARAFHERLNRHVGRRRQGDFADPVAADALHPVALDRAGAGAGYGAGDRLAARVELVRRIRRSLGRGDAGAGLPHDAQRPLLDHLDRGRAWRRPRRHFPDAGGHLADRERVRRRRRRACRARTLSGRASRRRAAARRLDPGRHQDGAADDPGLSDRAALRAVRRRGLSDLLLRHRLAARPRIFRTRGDALPLAGGSQGDAQGQCGDRVHRRACSSRRSCRSRSSTWRRRCSAWPSWSTCTSGCRAQGRS